MERARDVEADSPADPRAGYGALRDERAACDEALARIDPHFADALALRDREVQRRRRDHALDQRTVDAHGAGGSASRNERHRFLAVADGSVQIDVSRLHDPRLPVATDTPTQERGEVGIPLRSV